MDASTFQLFPDTVHRYVREKLVPLDKEVEELDRVPERVLAEFKHTG